MASLSSVLCYLFSVICYLTTGRIGANLCLTLMF